MHVLSSTVIAFVCTAGAAGAHEDRTVTVQVVDLSTREPLSGVPLRWWLSWPEPPEADPLTTFLVASGPDPLAGSVVATTDAKGVASLPARDDWSYLVGIEADRFGIAEIAPPCERDPRDQRPIVLALARDWDVRVRVRDADGAAQPGIPLALRFLTWGRFHEVHQVRKTGADGIGTLEHAGYWMARKQAAWPEDRLLTSFAGLDLWLPSPVQARIDSSGPSQAPVELVLPPTGAIAIHITEPDGKVSAGHVRGGARAAARGRRCARPDAAGARVVERRGMGKAERRGGRHRRHRGARPGRDLSPGSWRQGCTPLLGRNAASCCYAGVGDGPVRPGETTTITIPLAEPYVELRGRAVAGEEEPLRHAELAATRILIPRT
jgi:hypothetical protein